MSQSVLQSTGLTIGYDKPVLSGIDLDFTPGQFIALLGPNGAGKTTLLRTLSRHIEPLAGQIRILGRDLKALGALDLARAVSVCLTDNVKPPLLSVSEFVALGRYPYTDFMGRLSAHDVDIVRQSLEAVAAIELAERLVEQLSDGERQKVILARALAQEPKLMLLDEPTAHLDLKHRVEVLGILRSQCRAKGLTVLASLHDIDIAAKIADSVLLVGEGKIREQGLPEAVLTSETVTELYGFDAADFDSRLGGIEFRGDGNAGKAFVIAGRGTGATLLRLLCKKGWAVETGVFDEGDLDAFVATALGSKTFLRHTEPESTLAAAQAALAACDMVIDGGLRSDEADALRASAAERGLPLFGLAGVPFPTVACASIAQLSSTIDCTQGRQSWATCMKLDEVCRHVRHCVFPFSAILAQEEMKLALLLNAVNPAIGGVLIRGEKGTAKSTAARGVRELLPANDDGTHPAFVDFPLGATEDMLVGSIDFESAIRDGALRFQPGLLARAHQGVLYIDEVNLLDDHLVDSILDAAESGENIIEREGQSLLHPASFILIGTMNPEEGELRPQLLDRFGLAVSIGGDADPAVRVELLKRREAFDHDSGAFTSDWRESESTLSRSITEARERLPEVIIPMHLVGFISEICLNNHVAGHRADLVIARAAKAHAAWHGRVDVNADDILAVAPMALLHRMRAGEPEIPLPPPETEEETEKQESGEAQALEEESKSPETEQAGESTPSRGLAGNHEKFLVFYLTN